MTVMVTGGAGFIGARVTRRLRERGEPVVCFDAASHPRRLASLRTDPGLRIVHGDVGRFEDVVAAVADNRVERVIHCAALMMPVVEEEPRLAMRVNVMGATNVFEAARRCGVRRVVYASSIGVYGDQPEYGDGAVNEDALLNPNTIYGYTKQINEAVARKYTERFGLDCRALRPCSVFGYGREAGRSAEVARVISRAAVDGAVEARQGREQSACLIYVEDIAELFVRLGLAAALSHDVYVSGGSEATLGEVADIVKSLLPEADITYAANPETYEHVYIVDSSRIEKDLQYTLPPLEERIRDHINEARRDHGLPEVG